MTPLLPPLVGIYDIEVHTFDFSYNNLATGKRIWDERVSVTIKHLLEGFFENRNRAMIYVCDPSDGRSSQRNVLFKKWYENVADDYNRDDLEIEIIEDSVLYFSVIRHNEFPHDEILRTEVINRAKNIMMEKYGQ